MDNIEKKSKIFKDAKTYGFNKHENKDYVKFIEIINFDDKSFSKEYFQCSQNENITYSKEEVINTMEAILETGCIGCHFFSW